MITLVSMVASEPFLALAWDEAYTLARLDRVHSWVAALPDPEGFARRWDPARLRPIEDRRSPPTAADIDSVGELVNARNLAWFWPFAREEPHGHPAFYAIAALVGDVLTPWRPDLTRARLGSMLAFSAAGGAACAFAARRWGLLAGVIAAAAWALHPHLFALGHYATYDGLLASLWLLGTMAFATAAEPASVSAWWGRVVLFGGVLGLALGTKLTGWFLPAPLALWAFGRRDARAIAALAAGGVIGLLVLWAVTPPFWPDPFTGMVRFFESNLSRSETIPIKTQFLGVVYETPTGSLPWYNTLAWVVMATPLGFLCLALLGVWHAVRHVRAEPLGMLLVASTATLLVLRALPHTPGHDGTRQIAAAFGPLALLSGLGAAGLAGRLSRWLPVLSAAEGVLAVSLMMPVPLSYFSPLVGGLPGAVRLGMEPTYYWDALTAEALARLDTQVPTGRVVLFVANPVAWYYREAGLLRAGQYPRDGRDVAVFVLQNRPGSMSPFERDLVRRLGGRDEYILTRHFGVPLVWGFPAGEPSR